MKTTESCHPHRPGSEVLEEPELETTMLSGTPMSPSFEAFLWSGKEEATTAVRADTVRAEEQESRQGRVSLKDKRPRSESEDSLDSRKGSRSIFLLRNLEPSSQCC